MYKTYALDTLDTVLKDIHKPSLVFLYWDLWAWKTTLSKAFIQKILRKNIDITSPTYVYYNIYDDIHHFDLYRMSDYDEFVSIWGEEILDNNEGYIIVEWPQILEKYYKADVEIYIEKVEENENLRNIKVIYKGI